MGLNRRFKVVRNLEELKVIKTALGCFESPSNNFYLSPDIDEGFGVSGSRDLGVFEISHHEVKFRAHQEVHALLEMPRISPPMLLNRSIPFSHSFCLCSREVEDLSEFFFKEKDFFDRGSLIDLNHLRDEEMVFFGPSIHMFQKTPFHLPEFFSVKGPALSLERLSELDESILEIVPEPLHDVEVVVLERGVGPDFTDHFREGRPEVKDNAVGVDAPILKLSKESFCHTTAIKPRDGFDIKDPALESISSDLFISTPSSGHEFIEAEGSRELELAKDLREIILGGKTFLPSI
jgi:hypothetical protein